MSKLIERLNETLGAMTPPLEGGCLCGATTYVVSATPTWSGNCHCSSCQKLSGAPFVSAFSVPVGALAAEGETRDVQRTAASGNLVTTTHCAACGTRMFARTAAYPAAVNVFATTLREPSVFKAAANVYLCDKAAWIEPPAALFNFQKMPPEPKA